MKKATTLILIFTMVFALACSNNQKPVENTPSPTSTVSETPVLPTESPTEVPTAKPTATPEPTPLPDKYTYEEILALPRIPISHMVEYVRAWSPRGDLANVLAKWFGENDFIAECEILSVEYYIGWSSFGGYVEGESVITAKIVQIDDEHNSGGKKPGDIVTFKSGNYVLPSFWTQRYIFSKAYNTPIESKDDLTALKKQVKGYVKLPYDREMDYRYFYIDFDDFPMNEGERYTLRGRASSEDWFFADFIYPASYELDVAAFIEEVDFVYEERYLATAKEIAALFVDPCIAPE